jgi:hypothetical protein
MQLAGICRKVHYRPRPPFLEGTCQIAFISQVATLQWSPFDEALVTALEIVESDWRVAGACESTLSKDRPTLVSALVPPLSHHRPRERDAANLSRVFSAFLRTMPTRVTARRIFGTSWFGRRPNFDLVSALTDYGIHRRQHRSNLYDSRAARRPPPPDGLVPLHYLPRALSHHAPQCGPGT